MVGKLHNIAFNELMFDRDNVKRVFSNNLDYGIMLDECLDQIFDFSNEIFDIKAGIKIYDNIEFSDELKTISINSIQFDVKKTIFNYLNKSSEVAVFVCTAGDNIYELSRGYMAEGDFFKGYIFDMFGSLVVEKAIGHAQNLLSSEMKLQGLSISNRYSPGYCGWPVSQQKDLFLLIKPYFEFVKLSDTCLMQPIKSVSGIIGIGMDIKFNNYTCNICDSQNCLYKNLRTAN